jgi:hypothetical protein
MQHHLFGSVYSSAASLNFVSLAALHENTAYNSFSVFSVTKDSNPFLKSVTAVIISHGFANSVTVAIN